MSAISDVTAQAKLRVERARARWGWFDIIVTTFKRFSEDDAGTYAAALTYYVFFSIFPLILFGTALLGYLTLDEETQREIFDSGVKAVPMLRDMLSPDGFKLIEANRRGLALTGAALALYSGTGAIVALEHALNRLFGITEEPNFLMKRVRSLKFLALFGVAAVATVALTSVAQFAGDLFGDGASWVVTPLGYLLGVVVSIAIFAIAFRILPATDHSWRDVLPGAIVAALGFEVLKVAAATILRGGEESRNASFGVFAAAAGLLAAPYLVARVTLLAAEVNKVLAERRLTRHSRDGTE